MDNISGTVQELSSVVYDLKERFEEAEKKLSFVDEYLSENKSAYRIIKLKGKSLNEMTPAEVELMFQNRHLWSQKSSSSSSSKQSSSSSKRSSPATTSETKSGKKVKKLGKSGANSGGPLDADSEMTEAEEEVVVVAKDKENEKDE